MTRRCFRSFMDGQAELTWVVGCIPRRLSRPKAVTRPRGNRTRRRVTSLIETNALPLSQTATCGTVYLYIGWSDVTVISGHNTISTLWGNTLYCAKLSVEDLSRYSNKTEPAGPAVYLASAVHVCVLQHFKDSLLPKISAFWPKKKVAETMKNSHFR